MTTVAALSEAQTKILEKHKGGFTPSFEPMTREELLQEAEDIKAGRGISLTVEEVEAIADALYG